MKRKILIPIILILALGLACSVWSCINLKGISKVPELIEQLKDENWEVRKQAAMELESIGPFAKDAIPALIDALGDEKEDVSDAAYDAIGSMGLLSKKDLIYALKHHENPKTREKVATALAAIAVTSSDVITHLIEGFKDEDPGVQLRVTIVFGYILSKEEREEEVTLALVDALADNDPLVRAGAASALVWLEGKPRGEEVLPELRIALADDDIGVRVEAAGSIHAITGDSTNTLPILIEGLDAENDDTCFHAAIYISHFGPDAMEAIPALVKLIKSDKKKGSALAAHALGRIGSKAMPTIFELLEDEESKIKRLAMRALRFMPEGAEEAIPVLVELLEDKDMDVRILAALTLYRMENIEKEVIFPLIISPLMEALDSERGSTRKDAIWALSAIGPDAVEAIPKLREITETDDSLIIREAALEAIKAIEDVEPSADVEVEIEE